MKTRIEILDMIKLVFINNEIDNKLVYNKEGNFLSMEDGVIMFNYMDLGTLKSFSINILSKSEATALLKQVDDYIQKKEKEYYDSTIKWFKVKCSLFVEEFGVKSWDDLIDFMKHTRCFDYVIEGQTTEPYTGVEGCYENGSIKKL